ncbi:MAG: DUF721 domain-containing protein [Bacteroidetes bacterium]|nr:DUF721 domain-containing protein [Bacteroidota bacterium]
MAEDHRRYGEGQPLKEVIERLIKAYGLESRMKEFDIVQAWPDLMGPAVAFRTKEITVKNNVLNLKIDSSVMREELFLGKQIIIDRINEFAGKKVIQDIWFS